MEMNNTPIHLVKETTSWSKVLAENTFTTTSMETAGTTRLKSAQERAEAKRRKEMIKKRVPNQRVGLSMARGRWANQWLLPISFILMLRRAFPAPWASMAGINTAIVFLKKGLPVADVMGF
jgi:cell envelope opacity-associated protein A